MKVNSYILQCSDDIPNKPGEYLRVVNGRAYHIFLSNDDRVDRIRKLSKFRPFDKWIKIELKDRVKKLNDTQTNK